MRKSRNAKDTAKNRLTPLEARTPNQKDYIRAIVENDIIICSGPAGSGKSFIAAGMAAHQLHNKDSEISNIIVTRPLVCTGKDIGAVPGDIGEKVAPYHHPMEKHLKHFLTRAWYGHYFNEVSIQYRPLEVMRGETFDRAYMILDEAQNCTKEQIKMFMSRIGEGSKVLINGDMNQDDLRGKSGMQFCVDRLRDIDGVACCTLSYEDIQRNGIIGRVLQALEG